MSDPINTQPGQQPPSQQPPASPPAQQPPANNDPPPGPVPYERFKEINEKYRTLEKQFADMQAEQNKAREDELKKQQKFEELANQYKTELEQERMSRLKLQVAQKHNLPPELALRLQGTDEATLEADAKKVADLVKPTTPGVPPRGNGQPAATITEAQLKDPKWVRENIDKVWEATRSGQLD